MADTTQKTLVCLGDNITEGMIGVSYVDKLRAELRGVRVINAGVNGDTTLHLLRRVERDVIAHRPDVVTIMVGLNDLTTAYGLRSSKLFYRTFKNLQVVLTPPRFIRAYRQLLGILRERTNARLALCTLTTIGEQLDDPVQQYVDTYSQIIRALAAQERLPLIGLRGQTYATLAARRGYRLICDGAHLADAGAELVARTMLPCIRRLL